jgi:hypothetical protein
MTPLKRVFLFTIFAFLAHVSFAQIQVHVGATTAINATFVLDKGLSEDPRYNSTMTYNTAPIGFNFGVDFSNKFGLSLETILSNQGQIYEIIDIAKKVQGERKIDLTYMQLPLLLRFMSGGNGAARANFNIGPQMSFLTEGTESIQTSAGDYKMPEGVEFATIQDDYPAATQSPQQASDGEYTLPNDIPTTDILTKKQNDFKNAEFQIAAAFGVDIDIAKHLYLTTQIRANYSLTDMRNDDVIELLKSGSVSEIFGQRANLLVGIQLGLHYTFGVTRSFKFKG